MKERMRIMKLRSIQFLALGAILVLTSPVFAQINTEDTIELARTYLEADRKITVAAVMELSEEESLVFWPVYKEYRASVQPLNDRFIKLLKDYASNFENLSGDKAITMMSDSLDIEEDRLIYKRLYVERMAEVLPMGKVVRFFQIENKMDAVLKFDLAVEIPFASVSGVTAKN